MPKKFTYEEVKNFIENNGDKLLSDSYENGHAQIRIKCHCGNEYSQTFTKYKHGDRCVCMKEKIDNTYEAVKNYIESQNYQLLSTEYINQYNKIKYRCDKGHEYSGSFKHFKNGSRCPVCYSDSHKVNIDYVKKYLADFGYKLIGNYTDTQTKVKMECPEGHTFNMEFSMFKYAGHRCPFCRGTNGEQEIMRILNSYNIKYSFQHSFDDCRKKLPLPFDFYLQDKNKIIEYDGEIHFEPVKLFGGDEFYNQVLENDNIKNKYCKDNGIEMIRIPYWNFNNIEQILKDKKVV